MAAIELPTNRQSRYYDGPSINVHDPNYIPVLSGGAELKVDFSQPSFSALPSIPKPHENAVQTSLKRSKSGSAPEMVVFNHNAHPLPSRMLTRPKNDEPQELGSPHSPVVANDPTSSGSEDNTVSNSEGSTVGLENVFVIPGNAAPRLEEIKRPLVPHSARSSISSTKKSHVPTSRFNQKSPSLPALPPNSLQHSAHSPLASRVTSPEPVPSRRQSPEAFTPISTPISSARIEEPPKAYQTNSPRLHATKSTATDKRVKGNRSHFSAVSVKTTETSLLDETEEVRFIPQLTIPETEHSTTRSRGHSICSQVPTPAPTTPLPDLPPTARTPSIRGGKTPLTEKSMPPLPVSKSPPLLPSPKPSSIHSPAVSSTHTDHVEMAEFMTSKKMTIFRRFDDVHVRLLLHLQDEISALEKELKQIEEAGAGRPDTATRKANVMRELRKALAEYGELCVLNSSNFR